MNEQESDLRLLALAQSRTLTDNGIRHELDDVLAELNIVLDGINTSLGGPAADVRARKA